MADITLSPAAAGPFTLASDDMLEEAIHARADLLIANKPEIKDFICKRLCWAG
jgi:hypothetical protein